MEGVYFNPKADNFPLKSKHNFAQQLNDNYGGNRPNTVF